MDKRCGDPAKRRVSDVVAVEPKLQLSDFICSVQAYCSGQLTGVHIRPNYSHFPKQFAQRIKALQHRYQEQNGRWRGGIVVSDGIGQKGGGLLFQ
jgi:hypothetical protein